MAVKKKPGIAFGQFTEVKPEPLSKSLIQKVSKLRQFEPVEPADPIFNIEVVWPPSPPGKLPHGETSGSAGSDVATVDPEATTLDWKMLEDDRIITKNGKRYFPVALASDLAQAPRTTLLNWIKAKTSFQGAPITVYNSPTAHRLFVSEESVRRVAHRFVKWPSQKPAGVVALGSQEDQTGYIGIAKAAQQIGVDHHTMWLWTTQGKAPREKPLDVIKCSASDQFYILEKDLSELKKLVPRSGLKRGRRPSPTPL